jgi:branched-chain amino acid transport system ATP-binding protein
MAELLAVTNLSVSYGAIAALREVSLSIEEGEIVTLIGSNGAGKTTLLRAISGLLRANSGGIAWRPQKSAGDAKVLDYYGGGSELLGMKAHEIVRLGISHVPEGRQIFSNLTVRDNLLLGAFTQTEKKSITEGLDRVYALFPLLDERKTQRAGTLSGGEQQMLAIGRALMARPRLLLLDEPSLGLAPLIVKKIFEIIREINKAGTTVFLVEQNALMALKIAHRGYVLQTGQLILTDTAKNLMSNDEVKRAYLGG